MISVIELKVDSRLLAVITLLAFAHEGVAGGYVSVGDGGGVPPSSTPSASKATTLVPPSEWTTISSVPQLDADTSCNNKPCLRAAEPVPNAGELVPYGQQLVHGDEVMFYDAAVDAMKEKLVEIVTPTWSSTYKVLTNPIAGTLEAIGAMGAPASTGLGVFFSPTELGNGELPEELRQWQAKKQWDAKKQKFYKKNQQNVKLEQEAEKKKQTEANIQSSTAQQESGSISDAINMFVNTAVQYQQMKQQSTTASSTSSGSTTTASEQNNSNYDYGPVTVCTLGRTYDAKSCSCLIQPNGSGCPGATQSGGKSNWATPSPKRCNISSSLPNGIACN